MPGSWEYKGPDTLVAILTRGIVPTLWATSFRNLQLNAESKVIFLTGMPYDHARNSACESMLAGRYRWLFFLDDDVCPPPDAIERLKANKLDIVSGLYYRRHHPVEAVALVRNAEGQTMYLRQLDLQKPIVVDMVGAGCLLIHRRVLEQIKKPWFEWLLDRDDLKKEDRVSEDFAFCLKARNHGFKTHLDARVQCTHVGLGQAKIGNVFEPASL